MSKILKTDTATFVYDDLTSTVRINNILGQELEVQMEDLVKFVAEAFVRPSLIKIIENANEKDLLLGQFNPLEL